MKITVDLQACQGKSSGYRGIGRYSLALAQSLSVNNAYGKQFLSILLNDYFSLEIPRIKRELQHCHFQYFNYPFKRETYDINKVTERKICEELLLQRYQRIPSEVVLIASIFEGLGENVIVPQSLKSLDNKLKVGILYDLIPLIMQELYLQDLNTRKWYLGCLESIKQFDLLLAISEATRRDAIRLLDIPANKIVNIGGAADDIFRRLASFDEKEFLAKYGINRKFLLYTGGIDYRKNIEGLLQGYAYLNESVKNELQVVIVCSIAPEAKERLISLLKSLKVDIKSVIFTGFVSDEDLVKFYNLCTLFIFPSKYEGLGLPILEAMNCGAPVIGANNSSIAEIILRQDALFPTDDYKAMAQLISKVVRDPEFRDELIHWSEKRRKDFSWERSSDIALEAMSKAVIDKQTKANLNAKKKYQVAMMTPLLPQKTGIASYVSELIPELGRCVDLTIFTDADLEECQKFGNDIPIYSEKKFPSMVRNFDVVIYQMGNSSFHTYIYDYALLYPGIVVLHDFYLSGLINFMDNTLSKHENYFKDTLFYSHGLKGLEYFENEGVAATNWKYPMNKYLIDSSLGIVFHSLYLKLLNKKYYGENILIPKIQIPHIRIKKEMISLEERMSIRKKLKIAEKAIVIASFGFVAETKLNDLLLKAYSILKNKINKKNKELVLILVGELNGIEEYKLLVSKLLEETGAIITGYVDEEAYSEYMWCTNIAVQLRKDSRGETSGTVLDCLAHGIPTIVNAYAGFNEYPDSVVRKVSSKPSADELADSLMELINDEALSESYSSNGMAYISNYHNPNKVVSCYCQFIQDVIEKNPINKEKFLADTAQTTYKNPLRPLETYQLAASFRKNFLMPYHLHRIINILDDENWKVLQKEYYESGYNSDAIEFCRGIWKDETLFVLMGNNDLNKYHLNYNDSVVLTFDTLNDDLLEELIDKCCNIYFYLKRKSKINELPQQLINKLTGIITDTKEVEKNTILPYYVVSEFLNKEFKSNMMCE